VRWFHTGGIYAGLSEASAEAAVEAVSAARRYGTIVSYDLNYRDSLWRDIGGVERAQQVNQALISSVDVVIGNEEDFTAGLGFDVPGVDEELTELPEQGFLEMISQVVDAYPSLAVIATTLRSVRTATVNDWSAIAFSGADGFAEATARPGLEILDRVGGGDSFASGLIYGLLDGRGLSESVELGAAHGALAMTTPGDTSMATLRDVEALASGASARVRR
jgi:2-dehydro-3-deoxygluconokinase